MTEVSPDSKVIEILENVEGASEVFLKLGYKCADCPVNIEDTLIVAAKYHNKDINELLNSIRQLPCKNNINLQK